MYIDVDYNPSPSETFFISVGLNDSEAISFDYTIKGQRVIKQRLVEKNSDQQVFTEKEKLSSEWDILELKDGKFLNKRHVEWVDKGNIDEVDDEIWKTEWSKPISNIDKNILLNYSQYISDNYKNLDDSKMRQFEKYIKDLIKISNQNP